MTPVEEELLKKFQSDDAKVALEVLFENYADSIYRLGLSFCKDAANAEDIVQETFLAAISHRHQFQGRSSFGTWLYRIAFNTCHGWLRRKTELPLPEEDAQEEEEQIPLPKSMIEWRWTPEEMLMNGETRNELDKAIQTLPQNLRVVFLLRDIEELSTESTAEALGITSGAVKVRLHRARLQLRERLSSYFEEQQMDEVIP